jgi:hypothetical protein
LSGLVNRRHALSVAVLVTAGVVAFSVTQVVPDAPSLEASPAIVEHLVAQPEQVGATLVPAPVPTPVAAAEPARTGRAHNRHKGHRAHRAHRAHHRVSRAMRRSAAHVKHRARAERRARAQRRAQAARSRWRSGGGRDIGWPQCPHDVGFRGRNGLGQPMPDPGVRFVIVGLTNGRAFTPNPCLNRHLRWVRNHHVHAAAYAFATYPNRAQVRRYRHRGPYDGRRHLGALANTAHAAARYNVATMQRHGFTTPHVWLDVEPSSSRPWSGRRAWNRTVVHAWVRAYREAGYTVGFYSTTHLWRAIVGRLRMRLPEWRTAGPVSPGAALARCRSGDSFQGGPAVIAQWWTDHRDFDRICPGPSRATTMARYFHRW